MLLHRGTIWKAMAVVALAAGMAAAQELDLSCLGRPQFERARCVVGGFRQARLPGDGLRICSYNVENFTDGVGDGDARAPATALRHARAAAALLDEIRPDVVVLQEVENEQAVRLLNDALAVPFPVGYMTRFRNRDGQTDKLNIAVLSRVPLLEATELDFGALRGRGCPPRGALRFLVDLGDGRALLVYGVHLKSNFGRRTKNIVQRHNALRFVAQDARVLAGGIGRKVEMMVLGDVNTDPEGRGFAGDRSLDPLAGWVDLWRGRPLEERVTVPTRHGDPAVEFEPATFDRFFVSPDLRVAPWVAGEPGSLQRGVDTSNVHALPGETDLHVSDHYPVYVDLAR